MGWLMGMHTRFSACECMHPSFLQYATNAGHRLVLVTFVGLLVIAFAVILSPFPLPTSTLPYYPRTEHPSCPLSQFKTIGGGLPPLREVAKIMIGARQRRLCLYSCSLVPAPAKISHLVSHPHNTLACNHTSLPPPPHPHCCTS